MRKFVIATHRTLANGLKDSLNFFTNKGSDIEVLNAYVGSNELTTAQIETIFDRFDTADQVIIMTDLLGGSVTQKLMPFMNPNRILIAGINLPLALSLVVDASKYLDYAAITTLIKDSQQQIVLMNTYQVAGSDDDE